MAYYDYGHSGHHSSNFNDLLVEQLKRTPWLLYSGAIHAVIAIILHFFSSSTGSAPPVKPLQVAAAEQKQDELEEVKTEEETEEIKPEEEVRSHRHWQDAEIINHHMAYSNE